MPYTLKITLAITLTLLGPALAGIAGTFGYLLGGSAILAGGAFIALCACGAAATWWNRLVVERVEADTKALLEVRSVQAPARARAPLPGDIDKQQQRLMDMLHALGHSAADAIELGREINKGMGELGSHLAGVEAEKTRYQAEAEKVREIAAVAARPMRRLPDIGDTPGHKAGPDAYGRKGAALPEEDAVAAPAFLRGPPRLVERPAQSDRLKVDLAEIEEAMNAAAPVGG